ncbi:MAG: ankyrin repeat domain-containing protein [Acidobacteria bacterium]|nr:ankyrin repeat domain-containing protein [Acidobacteriota bacterium]
MRIGRFAAGLAALAALAVVGVADAASPLIDAVKMGNQQTVRALVSQRVDVNVPEPDGTTALHWAVRNDDRQMVDLLLAAGAKVGAANRYGITPLSLAAMTGSGPIAETLLRAGADANATLPEGETVLMTAARAGSAEVVRALLARGAAVDAAEGWQGQTALMWAAAENHADVVRVLVEAGADLNARSKVLDGMPPLRKTAPDVGQQGIHSTFPKGGLTPLLFAARQNAVDAVVALAEHGVDLDQKDPDGFTALIFAILNGHYDLAALLVDKGAGVDEADASGRTPLYAAVDQNTFEYSFNRPNPKPSGRMDPVDLVKFLLSRGANLNARLTDRVKAAKYDTAGNPNLIAGATPLLKAASTADVTLMRILLEAGADPFIRNAVHSNALHIAAGLNWRRLGSIGPEPDAIEALKILLDQGLDIHSYNDLGQTVLHAAAMRGRGGQEEGPNTVESDNLIRFLISRGARLDVRDKAGRTPLDMAIFTKNHEAAELYRQAAGVTVSGIAR